MKRILALIAALFVAWSAAFAADSANITAIEPTPLFPKPAEGQPLKQLARLHLDNPGTPFVAVVRITVSGHTPETQTVQIGKGNSAVPIQIPDIAAPTTVAVELLAKDGAALAARKLDWQPQKKWKVYCVPYSHQDLGFGDYPHRLRTINRHENILLALKYCSETDTLSDESKFRYQVEAGEPITTLISLKGKGAARELGRRMREGRIGMGRYHNLVNPEELSHELMARLFYMSDRYAADILGAPPSKTAVMDDVIGLTWPMATYGAEADAPYLFFGYNPCVVYNNMMPAQREPVFYWEGPDGKIITMRATTYGHNGSCTESGILQLIRQAGNNYSSDALIISQGDDFCPTTRALGNQVAAWNSQYAWPKAINATYDMFFDAYTASATPGTIKTFSGDAPNEWCSMDYGDARFAGRARLLSEELPATEKLAAFAQVVSGGADQWINTFQAYNRLLQYWEHSDGRHGNHYLNGNRTQHPIADDTEGFRWYETELAENKEMVDEAERFQRAAFTNASQGLAFAVSRDHDRNLIVFNPIAQSRTDVVRADIPAGLVPVDSTTGGPVVAQRLPDGATIFLAKNIPATGYKVFGLKEAPAAAPDLPGDPGVLENQFYRITWNASTGVITGLFDKKLGRELVEQGAPHAFNEYLYEFRSHTAGMNLSKQRGNPAFDSVWTRQHSAAAIQVSRGPVADVLTVSGGGGGVKELRQTVILYHHVQRVDFGLFLEKLPFGGNWLYQREAAFVALPFAIPDFTIHHELPGCVIEPYRQQFKGSCTAHYAIRSFTDFSNDKFGVTVSPIEGALVCYGTPNSSPMVQNGWQFYKKDSTAPAQSRLYLYLLNNMWDMNISASQPGPVSFNWALRSHAGDWKTGGADQFGRSIQQPLIVWRADGKYKGRLPASCSFLAVDAPNVMCSVVKPSEMNGRGYIVRLNETVGRETAVTVTLPQLKIESATATTIAENNRAESYPVAGDSFKITMPKFGVKTIRVTCAAGRIAVSGLEGMVVADMQVNLKWDCAAAGVSHFNIYRDTDPACPATLLNFIGQSAVNSFCDRPQVNIGGWLRSCIEPGKTYCYRVVPVDRLNNSGTPSAVFTIDTSVAKPVNLPPVAVEGLRVIRVSDHSVKDNCINILFRTACEPDVAKYEIHRSTSPGFAATSKTCVGLVDNNVPPHKTRLDLHPRPCSEYDHAMYLDTTVAPSTTYYYRVRAVDAAGQPGAFSEEVSLRSKEAGPEVAAQSVHFPQYGAENAVDGDPDPFRAWISKPYGGGTKDKPLDVWWSIEFPKKPVTIKGVKIIGDHRDIIPLQRSLQVQVRVDGDWKVAGSVGNATSKDLVVTFNRPVTTDAIRVFVPAGDLPKSDNKIVDGIVRICELLLVMPDGTEKGVR